ncbi:MAG: response regulator transcription factor [Pseudomonadota bacterium]|nr:response regulator transcription factor [Pseudomonadota bacterium]
MVRTILLYGLALALAASFLQWIEYQYVTRVFTGEFYMVLIAVAFTALGGWAGARLTARTRPQGFEKNEKALASLGVTEREYEVLSLLAAGRSNKEIARTLSLSPNTVKTHLARLYGKLEASRRTEAVDKARTLALIP